MTPQEIRILRRRLGMDQAQFASRLGICKTAVCRYERGRRTPSDAVSSTLSSLSQELDEKNSPRLLESQIFIDERGKLTVWGGGKELLPFPVVRKFVIEDVPPMVMRGGHAHKTGDQIISAMAGQFVLRVTRLPGTIKEWKMKSGMAIFIPRMHWIELVGFTRNAVCLVLCSEGWTIPITNFKRFKSFGSSLERRGQGR